MNNIRLFSLREVWRKRLEVRKNETNYKKAAERILERAPQCYQTFHLHLSQRENLKQRALVCSPPKTVAFRGQPDLGGLLVAPQALKSQPIAVSPSANIQGEEALIALSAAS